MNITTHNLSDTSAPDQTSSDVLACDGWWPSISLAAIRDAVRVPSGEVERLRDAARQAMLDFASEPDIVRWRAEQEGAGHGALQAVPSRVLSVDGKSDFELRWFRAVYSIVAADVGERASGPQASTPGKDRREALLTDVEFHQRNVAHAVRDFLGRPRIRARMI